MFYVCRIRVNNSVKVFVEYKPSQSATSNAPLTYPYNSCNWVRHLMVWLSSLPMANRTKLKIWMPVVDRLTNGSLYNDYTAVRHFSSRAAFLKLRVSFVPFVMLAVVDFHSTLWEEKWYSISKILILKMGTRILPATLKHLEAIA